MNSEEKLKKVTIGDVCEHNHQIHLCEYDQKWKELFQKEKEKIINALKGKDIIVEHVGSTSVPGLCAKPVIDISLVVEDSRNEDDYVPFLEKAGYVLKIREPYWYEHRMFKGKNPEVNLHVFSKGCQEAKRMIAFRDWLRTHEDDRQLYENTKKVLAKRKWKYIQDYADAKSQVVQEILKHMNM